MYDGTREDGFFAGDTGFKRGRQHGADERHRTYPEGGTTV